MNSVTNTYNNFTKAFQLFSLPLQRVTSFSVTHFNSCFCFCSFSPLKASEIGMNGSRTKGVEEVENKKYIFKKKSQNSWEMQTESWVRITVEKGGKEGLRHRWVCVLTGFAGLTLTSTFLLFFFLQFPCSLPRPRRRRHSILFGSITLPFVFTLFGEFKREFGDNRRPKEKISSLEITY